MTVRHDIVISGAGMVGMALAARLASGAARRSLRITVIDAQQEPHFAANDDVAPRVSAIASGSMQLLQTIAVRDAVLRARAGPYRDMRVWDATASPDGPEALEFSAADLALPELGFIVENELLRQCLLDRLRTLDVELRFQTPLAAIERAGHGFELLLEGGEQLRCGLLVGADGANSRVRRSAGIGVDAWQYSQAAVVTHACCEYPHRETAWQRFMPDGPLALLPLQDGRVSIVWSTRPERAEALLAADEERFNRALSDASDGVLGALQVDAPRASFPLRAQHARRYTDSGIVLVGDAAHTVHPLAGQGVNLGLGDAAVLASVLEAAIADGEYPADRPVLRRYERARKGANKTMLYFVDSLNHLFGSDSGLLQHLRGGGMWLFNRSGPLRRHVMRVALGMDAFEQH